MTDQNDAIKAAFTTTVKERLSLHPNNWAGEDSADVVHRIVATLKDESGNQITPTSEEQDVITMASRPTQELQVGAIRAIILRHKGKWDPSLEKLVKRVVNPTAFKAELVKAGAIKDAAASELSDLLG